MSIPDEIVALEAAARQSGFRVADILRSAEVDRSTWTRWRNGITSPRLTKWRAVNKAVEDLISRVEQAA